MKIIQAVADGIMVNPIGNCYFGRHAELNNDFIEIEISKTNIMLPTYILLKLKYNEIDELIEFLQQTKEYFGEQNG